MRTTLYLSWHKYLSLVHGSLGVIVTCGSAVLITYKDNDAWAEAIFLGVGCVLLLLSLLFFFRHRWARWASILSLSVSIVVALILTVGTAISSYTSRIGFMARDPRDPGSIMAYDQLERLQRS